MLTLTSHLPNLADDPGQVTQPVRTCFLVGLTNNGDGSNSLPLVVVVIAYPLLCVNSVKRSPGKVVRASSKK